jgi:hypothetical protein
MPQVLRVLRPGFPGLPWLRPFLGGPSWSKRSLSAVGHFQLIKKHCKSWGYNLHQNHGMHHKAYKKWDKNHNLHHLGWLKAYKKMG